MAVWRAADLDQPIALPGGGQAPLRARASLEVPVSSDAPIYDRLVGWSGRDPGWTSGP